MSDRIVVCGCHEGGWFTINSLLRHGLKISAIVTLDEDQAIRHKVSGYKDFRPLANEYDVPVYIPKSYSLDDPKDTAFFEEHRFDLLIQGGWQRLFPGSVLKTLRVGAVGGHGSADFLPKGRGRSPLVWSLIEGKKRFIKQLFLITPGIDDGEIFDYATFDINEFDDIQTLYYKAAIITERMLLRSVPKLLNGSVESVSQTGEPSFYSKRNPDSGKIDWENTDVWKIYDLIRAQTKPYPGAYGEVDGKLLRIWRAQVFDTRITYSEKSYGTIVETFEDKLVIHCRGGLLLVTEYEFE